MNVLQTREMAFAAPICACYEKVGFYSKAHEDVVIIYFDAEHTDVFLIIKVIDTGMSLSKTDVYGYIDDLEDRFGMRHFMVVGMDGFEDFDLNLPDLRVYLANGAQLGELIDQITFKTNDPITHMLPHNRVAYEKIKSAWKKNKRVAISHATGTGKSYIALKALYDNKSCKKSLVIAPSYVILDRLEQKALKCGIKNVEFMTYRKSMELTLTEIQSMNLSLIILDEYHRIGAEKWGQGVQEILTSYPNVQVLGTSATPIRYLDNARDMTEELSAKLVSDISLSDAIVKGILPPFKYVSALYTLDNDVERLVTKAEKLNTDAVIINDLNKYKIEWELTKGIPIILTKHLTNQHKSFIVFVQNHKDIDILRHKVVSWFKTARPNNNIKEYYVKHSESRQHVRKVITEFESVDTSNNTFKLLFSVNMLNEGLHVSDVDGVILLRKTESPNVYFQQIGRALQSIEGNKEPLIFDLVNNCYNVKTQMLSESLDNAAEEYYSQRETNSLSKTSKSRIKARFTLIDETIDTTSVLNSIFSRIDETRDDSWEKQYKKYAERKILKNKKDVAPLAYDVQEDKWADRQRILKRQGRLSQYRIDMLNAIGFEWDPFTEQWDKMFKELQEFKKTYAHYSPSKKTHLNLSRWIDVQRRAYKKGKMSVERIERLNSVGFAWEIDLFGIWMSNYNSYKECINSNNELTEFLQRWVSNQRTKFKENALAKNQIDLLNEIGFVWEMITLDVWMSNYNLYKECIANNEQLTKSLQRWVSYQRKKFKENTLSKNQIDLLNEIGFVWENDPFDVWMFNYDSYKKCIANNDQLTKFLQRWVNNQRTKFKRNELSRKQIDLLNEIEFVWEITMFDVWVSNYNLYKECIANNDQLTQFLQRWVSSQRTRFKRNELSERQINLLNDIGFTWEVEHISVWISHYNLYKEYVNNNDELTGFLQKWVNTQRTRFEKNELSRRQIKLLDKIKFAWDE